MAKLNKNPTGFEDKLDECTLKTARMVKDKTEKQYYLIEAKKQRLEAELSELNQLQQKYKRVNNDARMAESQIREVLDFMGCPHDANLRQTNKTYEELEELKAYIAEPVEVMAGDELFGHVMRIREGYTHFPRELPLVKMGY